MMHPTTRIGTSREVNGAGNHINKTAIRMKNDEYSRLDLDVRPHCAGWIRCCSTRP
jgi:hypothetical protein